MSRTRRRSKLEIYIDILRIVESGESKPTKIMYGTNLSWKPLQEALTFLCEKAKCLERTNLDEPKDKRVFNLDRRMKYSFDITEQGKQVLKAYSIPEKLFSVEEIISVPPVP